MLCDQYSIKCVNVCDVGLAALCVLLCGEFVLIT